MTYTVIGATRSRAFRLLWLLEDMGLPFEHIPAAPHSDAAFAHHPQGKVPALAVDDGPEGRAVLVDSVAIMTYLCDRHGQFTHPAGSIARAHQDALTQFLVEEFDNILWTATRYGPNGRQGLDIPQLRAGLEAEFAQSQASLVARMDAGGPYLMGDSPLLPDFLLAHCAGWAKGAGFALTAEPILAHLALMRARPSFKAALARG